MGSGGATGTLPAASAASRSSEAVTNETRSLWRDLCLRYLDCFQIETALFYAERFYYDAPCDPSSVNLLAQCYFRQGKVKQTYLILQRAVVRLGNSDVHSGSDNNIYLFALACFALDKFQEAEAALLSQVRSAAVVSSSSSNGLLSLSAARCIPGAAAGVYLLARVCRKQHRKETAVHYLKLALQLDAYLWCALEDLSELGESFDAAALFSVTSLSNTTAAATATAAAVAATSATHNSNNNSSSSSVDRKSAVDADNLKQLGAAEELSSPAAAVSASLGLASVALRVPFSAANGVSPSLHSSLQLRSSDMNSNSNISNSNSSRYRHDNSSYFRGVGADSQLRPQTSADHSGGGDFNSTSLMLDMNSSSFSNSNNSSGGIGVGALFGSATPAAAAFSLRAASGDGSAGHLPPHAQQLFSVSPTTAVRSQLHSATDDPAASANAASIAATTTATAAATAAGGVRRVSFGPTARLSFSGAFDRSTPIHVNNNNINSNSNSTRLSNDEQPLKMQKMTVNYEQQQQQQLQQQSPAVGAASALSSWRHSLSPFPMESSPIAPATLATPAVEESQRASSGYSSQVIKEPTTTATIATTATATVPIVSSEEQIQESIWRRSVMATATATVNRVVAIFAAACQQLCAYRCRECIETLQLLPRNYFHSALVSQWVGRAYYEMNEYKPAMLAFRQMLTAEPFRVKGLELLSTALWHLKRDKELSALAQQSADIDRSAPETWCVVGNCFSLQKEPDSAVKFFQRALQLDAGFTYAHTLSGHEQVSNEDMDKAVESFRLALLSNDRHYNAWYGLGSIYYRQERFELAEFHFRRALALNPASSVLHCYLGMALHAQSSSSKTAEALEVLGIACEKDFQNPQLHFQRAHILAAEDELEAALRELQIVAEFAPKEAPVHALLAQVHHRRGELQLALRHFNTAMDLDPKEAAALKTLMDNFDQPQME